MERGDEVREHLLRFGRRVRELRRAREMSQEKLADLAGFHRTIIGFIERGEREVGISKLWPLADALGVSVPDLFSD